MQQKQIEILRRCDEPASEKGRKRERNRERERDSERARIIPQIVARGPINFSDSSLNIWEERAWAVINSIYHVGDVVACQWQTIIECRCQFSAGIHKHTQTCTQKMQESRLSLLNVHRIVIKPQHTHHPYTIRCAVLAPDCHCWQALPHSIHPIQRTFVGPSIKLNPHLFVHIIVYWMSTQWVFISEKMASISFSWLRVVCTYVIFHVAAMSSTQMTLALTNPSYSYRFTLACSKLRIY